MQRLAVDPAGISGDLLAQAALVIRRAGVVAFPTDTLYGLAVDPFNPLAVDRLFAVKGRAGTRAIALIASDVEQIEQWLSALSPPARRLADQFWPGPLTLLVRAPGTAAERRRTAAAELAPGIAAADGTVGVRVPDHGVARALCRACQRPVTATSANLSGAPATANPADVARALQDRIDLLVDAGPTPGGPASTIVDATTAELRLVRTGAIDWDTIQQCASRK